MKGLVGPSVGGGLGPGPLLPPLKSGPVSFIYHHRKQNAKNTQKTDEKEEISQVMRDCVEPAVCI